MSDATNDDIRAAYAMVAEWDAKGDASYIDLARMIAALRAAERDKARAPFLALADELAQIQGSPMDYGPRSVAARIRRAAQDNP
jgi:hypothetical protein